MRRLILFFMALLCGGAAYAQLQATDPQLKQAMALMNKLQVASTAAPYSCHVEYRYSNASTPQLLLDSMQGVMTVDNNRYFRVIGNTEMLHNNRYDVTAFNADSLIYVTNALATDQGAQPLDNLQAMLKDSLLTSCTINGKGHTKTVRFLFRENASCKSMEVVADTVKMKVIEVNTIIKTSLMTMGGVMPGEEYEEYARMSVRLSDYKSLTPAAVTAIFDEKRFFHKTEEHLVPAAAYAGYQVFSGSPQLQ